MDSLTPPISDRALRPPKELLVAWMLLLIDVGEDHGYALHHGLLGRGIDLQATTVYRWLAKFERDGWVLSAWSEPIDGPRRHVYRLTAEGRAALRERTELTAAMRDSYSTFLDAHARAVARRRSSSVDEAAVPIMRDVQEPTPDVPVEVPQVSSAQRALRPHRELLIGWLLLQLDAGATYGYDLRRAFDAQRLTPDPGALYRMLHRLEADKWVQSRWLNPAAGPRRRFYRLTGRGRRNLDEIARLITAIRDAHDAYLVAYEHASDNHDAASDSDVGAEPRQDAAAARLSHQQTPPHPAPSDSPAGRHDQAISHSEVPDAQAND